MRIEVLTIFPDMFTNFLQESMVGIASEIGAVDVKVTNIRDFATDKHKTTDDYPYGGGAGMVMMIEPIATCIESLTSERAYDEIIYMSPDGELLDQKIANQISLKGNVIILCGHYKGIDERIREHFITKEISIGNYVLSGGELAAAVFVDSIIRLIPGVLGDETSALSDSFQNNMVSPPVYTRPREFRGWEVPKILLSGNEKLIEEWKYEQSLKRTVEKKPELLDDKEEQKY